MAYMAHRGTSHEKKLTSQAKTDFAALSALFLKNIMSNENWQLGCIHPIATPVPDRIAAYTIKRTEKAVWDQDTQL